MCVCYKWDNYYHCCCCCCCCLFVFCMTIAWWKPTVNPYTSRRLSSLSRIFLVSSSLNFTTEQITLANVYNIHQSFSHLTSPLKSHLGRVHRYPSQHRMLTCFVHCHSPMGELAQIEPCPTICCVNYSAHNLIQQSLDQPHSPLQTASGSSQPFCHSTLSGHRQTPTDRWSRWQTYTKSAYTLLIESDALIIITIIIIVTIYVFLFYHKPLNAT